MSSQSSIPPPTRHLPAPPTAHSSLCTHSPPIHPLAYPITPPFHSLTCPSIHPALPWTPSPCCAGSHPPTPPPTHPPYYPLTSAFAACLSHRPIHQVTLKPACTARCLENTDPDKKQPLPSRSAVCGRARKANQVCLHYNKCKHRLRQGSQFSIPEQRGASWGAGAGLREGGSLKGWMEVETPRQGQSKAPGPYPQGGRGSCRVSKSGGEKCQNCTLTKTTL